MNKYNFHEASDVLSYINLCNPARAKHVNLLEIDKKGHSPLDSNDWAMAMALTHRVLKAHNLKQRTAFELRYFGDRDERYHVEEIA